MEQYLVAQIIGFVGYTIYIAAPQFKNSQQVIKADMLACVVLSLQWALLFQPTLVLCNALAIAASAVALSTIDKERKDKVLLAFYPLSVLLISMIWEGTVIDILAIFSAFCMIASRRATTEACFRKYGFISGVILMGSGYLAFSAPAVIFNFLAASGHLQKLCGPWLERSFLRFQRV